MSLLAATPSRIHFSRDVWLISLGHGLTHWYTATFYLLLPLIGRELGLSYTEIGLIMTIQHLAGAISNIPGGILVDTVGNAAASARSTPSTNICETRCGSSAALQEPVSVRTISRAARADGRPAAERTWALPSPRWPLASAPLPSPLPLPHSPRLRARRKR